MFNAGGGRFGQSGDPNCTPNPWVVRPDGSGLHRLVRAGVQPAYSPDGRRIAFVRPDARETPWLYVVSSTGRGLRRVGVGSHPSWSPDGRRLVVERPVGPNRIADLWVVRVSDWRATRLTRTATVAELGPTWSPEGRWIAFSAVVGGEQNIYALRVSGGTRRAITHTGGRSGDYDPA